MKHDVKIESKMDTFTDMVAIQSSTNRTHVIKIIIHLWQIICLIDLINTNAIDIVANDVITNVITHYHNYHNEGA